MGRSYGLVTNYKLTSQPGRWRGIRF